MRYLSTLFILVVIMSTCVKTQSSSSDLNSVLEKAYEFNPGLRQLLVQVKISELNTKENSNLLDPVLGFGLANLPVGTFKFNEEPMTGKTVSLSQSFPFPGKLTAKENLLNIDSEIALQNYESIKLKLRKEIIDTYFSLAYQQKKISLYSEKLSVFDALVPVIKTRYEVGKSSQQDLISIQLRISNLREKLFEMESHRDEFRWLIEGLTSLEFGYDISSQIDSVKFHDFEKDILLAAINANNPQLRKTQLQQLKSDRLYALSKYKFYPDFNLSLQYTQRDELAVTGVNLNDFFSARLNITLPINYGGNKSASLEKAIKLKDHYKEMFDNLFIQYSIMLNQLLSKIESNNKRLDMLQNTILLQANENFNAALASYQVGQIEFINVIESLNLLLGYEDELYNLKLDTIKNISSVEELTAMVLLHSPGEEHE